MKTNNFINLHQLKCMLLVAIIGLVGFNNQLINAQSYNTNGGNVTWTPSGTGFSEATLYISGTGQTHGDAFDEAVKTSVSGTGISSSVSMHYSSIYSVAIQQVVITNSTGSAATYTLNCTGNLGSDGNTYWHYVNHPSFNYSVSSDNSSASTNGSDPVLSLIYGWNYGYGSSSLSYSNGSDSQNYSISNATIAAGDTHRYLFLVGLGSIDDQTNNRPDNALNAVSNLQYVTNWPSDFTNYLSGAQMAEVKNWQLITNQAPGTPTSLSISPSGTSSVNISWAAGSPAGTPSPTYYWVLKNEAGTTITSGNTTGTSASVSDLTENTSYYFTVYANNNSGSSGTATSSSSKTYPANPTSISGTTTINSGENTTLTANGAQGTVYWYSGSCGGTYINTGNTLEVSPSSTTTYYARNYNGNYSSGCASATVTVNFIAPTSQATNLTFSSTTDVSTSISWTNGNGSSRAVFMKAANSGSASPVNGTTYTASTSFSSGTQIGSTGWYCVYNGTGTSVAVSNLTIATNYSVMVVEYNGTSGYQSYQTSSSTNNPKTFNTSTSKTFDYSGSIINWTVPAGVTSITVNAYGAQGGNDLCSNGYNYGGLGARMSGTFSVTPGNTIQILAGGQGGNSGLTCNRGGGGGGGSYVYNATTSTLMLAAGGGGGAGQNGYGSTINANANITTNGNAGANNGAAGGASGYGGNAASMAGGGAGWLSNGATQTITVTQFGLPASDLHYRTTNESCWNNQGKWESSTDGTNWTTYPGEPSTTATSLTVRNDVELPVSKELTAPVINVEPTARFDVKGNVSANTKIVIHSNETNTGQILNAGTINNADATVVLRKTLLSSKGWYFMSFPYNVPLANIKITSTQNSATIGNALTAKAPYENIFIIEYDGEKRDRTGQASATEGMNWVAKTSGSLQAGKGYSILVMADQTFDFVSATGENALFDATDKALSVGVYNSNQNTLHHSWNLVGTPYASAFNMDNLSQGSFYYMYNPATLTYIVQERGDSYNLNPFGAFFVQSTNIAMNFAAEGRALRAPSAKQTSEYDEIALQIKNNNYSDLTRIRLWNNAIENYEMDKDAVKMFSQNNAVPQLWSKSQVYNLSVNSLPRTTKEIWLNTKTGTSGNYSIELTNANKLGNVSKLMLVDNVLGTQTDLLSQNSYTFNASAGTTTNRFKIVLKSDISTQTDKVETNLIDVKHWKNKATIDGVVGSAFIRVYDAAGRAVQNFYKVQNHETITLTSTEGCYVMEIITDTQHHKQVLIIKM